MATQKKEPEFPAPFFVCRQYEVPIRHSRPTRDTKEKVVQDKYWNSEQTFLLDTSKVAIQI